MSLRQHTFALLALAAPCFAQKPAPAAPAAPSESGKLPASGALISSEMGGRDLVFLANALDLGRAMAFLGEQASRTTNERLKAFSDDLSHTLSAHSAVIATVAEMRNVNAPKESPTEKRLSERLSKLDGIKREKAIMDAFIDLEERLLGAYQLGLSSSDITIVKFCEQALPQAEKHLHFVQGMAGIAPKRATTVLPLAPSVHRFAAPEITGLPKEESLPVVSPTRRLAPEIASPEVASSEDLPATAPSEASKTQQHPETDGLAKKEPLAEPVLPPLPEPIAEAPKEDASPKKPEAGKPKPAKRPVFRTNVKPLTE